MISSRGTEATFEFCFGELAESSDPMLIGFPDLARYGYEIQEDDDDGHILGGVQEVRYHYACRDTGSGKGESDVYLAPNGAAHPRGTLRAEEVEVYCSTPETHRWVSDDRWPGVRVIEGPLVRGRSRVTVAVDNGARAIICGHKVPWKVTAAVPEIMARAAASAVFTAELGSDSGPIWKSRRQGTLSMNMANGSFPFAFMISVTIFLNIGYRRNVSMCGARCAEDGHTLELESPLRDLPVS